MQEAALHIACETYVNVALVTSLPRVVFAAVSIASRTAAAIAATAAAAAALCSAVV